MKRMTLIVAAVVVAQMLLVLPARAAADLSSPKAAAMTFAKAVEAGDVQAAKAAAINEGENAQLIETLTEVAANVNKLRDAAKAKFGDGAAEQFVGNRKPLEEMSKQLDKAEVKQDGDSATISSADQPGSTKLKKIGSDWKVDLAASLKDSPQSAQIFQQLPFLKAIGVAMGETAGEISADKYKTVDEAKQAMQAKMMAAMATMRRPAASQPATPATATTAPSGS